MDPQDPILQRWLSRVQSDAPLRLGQGVSGEPGPANEQEARLWRRLQLVQGLLGTLDQRTAPAELDDRVAEFAPALRDLQPEPLGGSEDLGLFEDLYVPDDSPAEFPVGAAGQAPEFLDRLVQQKFDAMAAQLAKATEEQRRSDDAARRARSRFTRPLRRVSLVASGLLVVALMPWGSLLSKYQSNPRIEVTQYSTLEGLRAAHPEAAHFASQTGDFGAFFGGSDSASAAPENKPKPGEAR